MNAVWSAVLTVALTVTSAPFVLAQNFDEGMAATMAYEDGDYETALSKWRPLAEEGDAWAQFGLGLLHSRGQGVPRDPKQAFNWFLLAAEQGIAPAQFRTGLAYGAGTGVAKNSAEAMRWYLLAAGKDNDDAQYMIGSMYHRGEHVPQDYAEAMVWFRRAAEQGNENAHFQLGSMYWFGWGVPQDYVTAHMWYNVGAARERDSIAQVNKHSRDNLAEQMTASQIAEAQRMARECLKSGYKNCGW